MSLNRYGFLGKKIVRTRHHENAGKDHRQTAQDNDAVEELILQRIAAVAPLRAQRAGFALPVADSETITVTYPDMLALMRDLRGMGETNALAARRRGGLRRATLARAAVLYAERFGDGDGRIPASFEILFLCGWAPHPSQPQPLRRGSATAPSLA